MEKPADTSYVVVHSTRSAAFGHVTTVDLWAHTGRTHQLRRHLAGVGHPIVGEMEHCSRQLQLEFTADDGLFLYAVELSLPHPVTNELLTVHADEPPRYATYRDRQAASCI
jgi:23S rRNA pseudouridine1911/1915/1917 synthase